MKIVSELGNTKADKEIKRANLAAAHGRYVRYHGNSFRIHVAVVGDKIFATAENSQHPVVNLFDDSQMARDLKKLCENRLYT